MEEKERNCVSQSDWHHACRRWIEMENLIADMSFEEEEDRKIPSCFSFICFGCGFVVSLTLPIGDVFF